MAKTTLSKTKSRTRTLSMKAEIPATAEAATIPVTTAMPAPSETPAAAVSCTCSPTHEEIARRAHEIYIARGQVAGRELDDWIQAEQELLAKANRNN